MIDQLRRLANSQGVQLAADGVDGLAVGVEAEPLGDGNDGPTLGGGHLAVAGGATAVAVAGLITGSLGRAAAPGSRPCWLRATAAWA